jgi:hypothetical protein
MRFGVVVALFALGVSPVAGAKTLAVAVNGADSGACGPATAPCRSISAALANAADGDKIVVGPGRYGDVTGDGDFDDAGEEAASPGSGCLCVVNVTKRVTLSSRDGTDVTVIDGVAVSRVVHFDTGSAGATLSGFTITGGATGVYVESAATDLRLLGDVVRNGSGDAFYVNANGAVLQNDRAIGHGVNGFNIDAASGASLRGCVAQSNAGGGFYFTGVDNGLVKQSLAIANGDFGFASAIGGGVSFTGVAALDNGDGGVLRAVGLTQGKVTGSSIVANGWTANCGVYGDANFDATKNFWGAATGPGVSPANGVCPGSGTVTTAPFKQSEIKVVPKAIR